jgi:(2R)-ethylmalonyl-CoA mutase
MTRKGKEKSPWMIRTYAGFGGAEESNRRFQENLRAGQNGLSVAFDLPTQNGYDPDHPMARGEIGGCGVSIAHTGDMDRLFKDIDLGSINTSMTINATAPFLLALYLVVAEKRGISWTRLRGTVQNDLLKEFVARGTSIFDPRVSLRLSADLITFSTEQVPQWNPINVCGYHYMESGAGPTEEIAFTFANAMMILDAVQEHLDRQKFETVVRRISFFINSGIELVPEICKMRAYARLWPVLCRELYGLSDVPFRAGCQVRSISLPAEQPENNIVRIALEALPAIFSADARVAALQLPGFREATNLPDQMEQTLSIRTQQILMHETKIHDYPDIFEGSQVIAGLTNSMMQDAKALALDLRTGGYDSAMGAIDLRLTECMLERQRRMEERDDIVVGVNMFHEPVGLSGQLQPAPPTSQDKEFEQRRIAEVISWRETRDKTALAEASEKLRQEAANGKNLMQTTIAFARAGGTVGEWTSAIESVTSGRYSPTLAFRNNGTGLLSEPPGPPLRIVLGKSGLDGHNNAVKLMALACRDAGMEVVYVGTKVSPEGLIRTAMEEDASVLAISSLSGTHLHLAEKITSLRQALRLDKLKVAFGGIIPEEDRVRLTDMGVDLIVTNSSIPLKEIALAIRKLAG